MIDLYLCDDDPGQLSIWKKIIERTLIIEEWEHEFALRCVTSHPEELLDTLRSSDHIGLYFLDIQFGDDLHGGLVLAQEIRKSDPRGYIVFITSHDNMMPVTFLYKVSALGFIRKDDPGKLQTEIKNCITSVLENHYRIHAESNNLLTLKAGSQKLRLQQDEIVFIECSGESHKLTIHMTQEVHQVSGSLNHVASLLNSNFQRCDKSVIVNLSHAQSFDRTRRIFLMDNQEECPVSLRLMKSVLDHYNRICNLLK